jgi:NADPH-dependent 2,4-dienoyl-CoA reductase/sulfur reductase-like enzyme/nitrite reductase/ring-hydroxylating ferredoxin subunit
MKKVASLPDLPEDRGLRVEVDGEKILLVRDGDAVRAYSAICPHAGAPLEEGAVCNGRIVCPWHKGAFRLSDGALVEPPALDGLNIYPVRVDGDEIFVEPKGEPQPPARSHADSRTFVIVGAGAAGATAAAALREFGFGGRVVLIGREPGLPYDRTSLSKFVVSGEMKPEETPLLRPEGYYATQRIEQIEAEVARFDVAKREVTLADKRKIAFDRALIAPGGEAKTPELPGVDKAGVHVLRSREDAAAILAELRPGARAIVLGSSFIGLEVASCLRAQKASVTVVSPEEIPFIKQFGEKIGRSIRSLHEANGVVFEAPAKAAKLEGEGRISGLVSEDGRRLAADLIVVGVGVRPATRFVVGSELTKDRGLPVDATLRLAEGIYAAGDAAAFPMAPDGKPTRIEHWRVAQQQARIAAANMLGGNRPYEDVPFFWTYHYGKNFEYLGHAESWDDEIVRGDISQQQFVSLFLRRGRVAAVVACERQRLTATLVERMRTPLMRDEALRMVDDPSFK